MNQTLRTHFNNLWSKYGEFQNKAFHTFSRR